MRPSAIAMLFIALLFSVGIIACNNAGTKGAGSTETASADQPNTEETQQVNLGPGGYIGNVTSVTGSSLPRGFEVDYSGGTHVAPAFVWKNAAGETGSLGDYRGKVVMVNFWGTWCPPCRRELPDIVRLRNDLGPKGFEVIGVAIGERVPAGVAVEDHLAKFAKANNLEYPLIIGNQDLVRQYGGIGAVPTTFIVDRDGHVVNMLVGGKSEAQFRQAVERVL